MASNTITGVAVTNKAPTVTQPSKMSAPSGKSDLNFTFLGVFMDANGYVNVVVKADKACKNPGAVNSNKNGGVWDVGADGIYCEMVTDTKDKENWTALASATSDPEGGGITFVAGNGGGHGPAATDAYKA